MQTAPAGPEQRTRIPVAVRLPSAILSRLEVTTANPEQSGWKLGFAAPGESSALIAHCSATGSPTIVTCSNGSAGQRSCRITLVAWSPASACER